MYKMTKYFVYTIYYKDGREPFVSDELEFINERNMENLFEAIMEDDIEDDFTLYFGDLVDHIEVKYIYKWEWKD